MKREERLFIITKLAKENDGYGGELFELPSNHKASMISKSGFSCASCKFAEIRKDGPHCTNKYWVQWNDGETRLPVDDPKIYCSDWFSEKK